MYKILLVDDEKNILIILHSLLTEAGYSVKTADSGERAIKFAKDFEADLLITDLKMKGMNGIETMNEIQKIYPSIKTIIMTAFGTVESAVEAIKKGAYDYITKPFDNDDFLLLVQRVLEYKNLQEEVLVLRNEVKSKYDFSQIIGESSAMNSVFKRVHKISPINTTVLILGESGTGKELIARAIHYSSSRQNKPFIPVNCGAIPENLIETELFGHEKGSFTGALFSKKGKFEEAHNGTLFLDEIGELSLDAQVKFLRVLQEFQFARVGGNTQVKVDIRLIAATNKNLEILMSEKKFREDLYYRLNVFSIEVPPLRERKEDIPLLVEHFISKYNKRLQIKIKGIEKEALSALSEYYWPGNVRELENNIHQAMIVNERGIITKDDLPERIKLGKYFDQRDTNVHDYIKKNGATEKEKILEKLRENLGSRSKTAHDLGMSRTTLFLKMKKYGIG